MVAPSGVGGVVGVAAEVPVEELGRTPKGTGAAQGLRRRRPVSCKFHPWDYLGILGPIHDRLGQGRRVQFANKNGSFLGVQGRSYQKHQT